MRQLVSHIIILASMLLSVVIAFGQPSSLNTPPSTEAPATTPSQPAARSTSGAVGEWGRVGFGVKASLLGGGVELAAAVTHHTNVRAGFNMFTYSRTFHKDSIDYDGQIALKTVEAHYDIFPWAKSFHISPGVLAYIGDPVNANASVLGGQSFTLAGTTYFSDVASPVAGKGRINFNRAAPMVTFGWGNLVRHGEGRHITVPFEMGVAFQGAPKATLNLTGNVCDAPAVNCRSIASDPTVQSHIQAEQTKLNNDISFLKVYPIISIGVGYKF